MRNNGNKPKYLKEEEVKKLLSIAKGTHSDFYPLLYTAITTGIGMVILYRRRKRTMKPCLRIWRKGYDEH